MTTIASRSGNIPAVYRATVNLYFRYGTLADYADADRIDRQLVAIEASSAIDPELRRFADSARGICAMWKGELALGMRLLEPITEDVATSGAIGGILGNADRVAFLLLYQCSMRWVLGDAELALEEALRGVQRATVAGDPYTLGATLCILARLRFWREDDPREIRAAAERVPTIPEANVWHTQAMVLAAAARSRQAPLTADEVDEIVSIAQARVEVFPMGAPAMYLPVVEMLRIAGQRERAAAIVEETLVFIREKSELFLEPEFLRLRGDFLADDAAAAEAYRAALASARLRGAVAFETRTRNSMAARGLTEAQK
jgi:hypothetical protein